jgi:hypothetical protein
MRSKSTCPELSQELSVKTKVQTQICEDLSSYLLYSTYTMLVIPQAILSGAIFNTILHLEKLKLKEIK